MVLNTLCILTFKHTCQPSYKHLIFPFLCKLSVGRNYVAFYGAEPTNLIYNSQLSESKFSVRTRMILRFLVGCTGLQLYLINFPTYYSYRFSSTGFGNGFSKGSFLQQLGESQKTKHVFLLWWLFSCETGTLQSFQVQTKGQTNTDKWLNTFFNFTSQLDFCSVQLRTLKIRPTAHQPLTSVYFHQFSRSLLQSKTCYSTSVAHTAFSLIQGLFNKPYSCFLTENSCPQDSL